VITTPKDITEKSEVLVAGDIYQVWRFDNSGPPRIILDNSKIYPVDTDWSVKRSS